MATGLLMALGGCGGNPSDIAPVRGVVEFDGKPLPEFDNAAVIFTPAGGRLAKGVIKKDGSFVLSTYGKEDGAVVGAAKVAVSATVDAAGGESIDRQAGVRWVIPEKFADADASGLTCEVKPGEENEFRIRLSADGTGSIERMTE